MVYYQRFYYLQSICHYRLGKRIAYLLLKRYGQCPDARLSDDGHLIPYWPRRPVQTCRVREGSPTPFSEYRRSAWLEPDDGSRKIGAYLTDYPDVRRLDRDLQPVPDRDGHQLDHRFH